jgi:2-iminobutanoate/2-iminopropanoate deaminase
VRNRWISLSVAGIVAILAFSVGASLGKGESFTRLNLPGRVDDLPFSHVVVAGDTIYVAGTLGLDPETGRPPADVAAEVRLVLDGIKNKLALAGATMDDLVSVQIFCPDLTLYEEFNSVYATYFEKGFPSRAFIGSGPLLRGSRFEINGIAVKR